MAPHALSPPRGNGYTVYSPKAQSPVRSTEIRSMLPETEPDELHDLICVGFGPAGLAIAVALHDGVEFGQTGLVNRQGSLPKVAFLEKQSQFAWHAGMQLPGAKMQISWIKDLATLRNPRSSFTFLNYLHSVGRLVSFSNLGTFTPLRIEYEAYMKWCAGWFEHLTSYDQEGVEVLPQTLTKGPAASDKADHFLVRTKNLVTGEIEERRSRHVVIGTGGQGQIPAHLPQSHPRLIHSSTYLKVVGDMLTEREKPYRVAVIGAGQSAAEIFHDLQTRFPNSQTRLMIRGSALKPSDDSPFVNETFNPEHVDDVFAKDAKIRKADISEEQATNYGVVRLNLLEDIYSDLYEQTIRHPELAESEQQHQILPFRDVVGVDDIGKNRLKLRIDNRAGQHFKLPQEPLVHDEWEADAVIIAAGYRRDLHEKLLSGARNLMPGGDKEGKKWTVHRDYGIEFEPGTVKEDAGIWLQGCNQETHGVSFEIASDHGIEANKFYSSVIPFFPFWRCVAASWWIVYSERHEEFCRPVGWHFAFTICNDEVILAKHLLFINLNEAALFLCQK